MKRCYCALVLVAALAGPALAESLGAAVERFRAEGKPVEGLAWVEAAVARDPADAEARTYLGEFLWAAGRLPEARRAFEAALALDPERVWARVGLAHLLRTAGDHAGAGSQFERAAEAAAGTDAVEIFRLALGEDLLAKRPAADVRASFEIGLARYDFPLPLILDYTAFMTSVGADAELGRNLRTWALSGTSETAAVACLDYEIRWRRDVTDLIPKLLTHHRGSLAVTRRVLGALLAANRLESAAALADERERGGDMVGAATMRSEIARTRGDLPTASAEAARAFILLPTPETALALVAAAEADPTAPDRPLDAALRCLVDSTGGERDALLPIAAGLLAASRLEPARRLAERTAERYPAAGVWPILRAKWHLARGERAAALEAYLLPGAAARLPLEETLELSTLLFEAGRSDENRLLLTRSLGLFPDPASREATRRQALRTGQDDLARGLAEEPAAPRPVKK